MNFTVTLSHFYTILYISCYFIFILKFKITFAHFLICFAWCRDVPRCDTHRFPPSAVWIARLWGRGLPCRASWLAPGSIRGLPVCYPGLHRVLASSMLCRHSLRQERAILPLFPKGTLELHFVFYFLTYTSVPINHLLIHFWRKHCDKLTFPVSGNSCLLSTCLFGILVIF